PRALALLGPGLVGVLLAGGCRLLVGHLLNSSGLYRSGGSVESNGRYVLPPFFFTSFQALGTRGEAGCFRSRATVCACFLTRLDRRFASVWSPACSISPTASSRRCRSESGSTARRTLWGSAPEHTASAASRNDGGTNSPTAPERARSGDSPGLRTRAARITNSAWRTEGGRGFPRSASLDAAGGARG